MQAQSLVPLLGEQVHKAASERERSLPPSVKHTLFNLSPAASLVCCVINQLHRRLRLRHVTLPLSGRLCL